MLMQPPRAPSLSWCETTANYLTAHMQHSRAARRAVAGFAQLKGGSWWGRVGGYNASASTIYDLASVSKPLTALTTSSLVQEGKLAWETKLDELLPFTRGTFAGAKTVAELLSHRAGLSAHREFFRAALDGSPVKKAQLLRWAACARGAQASGSAVYSDLGYMLVGAGIEWTLGQRLDAVMSEQLAIPWQLEIGSMRSFRRALPLGGLDLAATEVHAHRGGVLSGMVHDDNAWAIGGWNCAGHAGLFCKIGALLELGIQLLDRLETPLVAPLVQPRPGGSLLMGFDGRSSEKSSAGKLASARTFGHLGFTGTSFWVDPERQRVTVLLTNRVHPTRDNPRLAPLRSIIHDFLWGS